jgi:two-component system cell cycle sensor histidine kinase/response regulator CckA
VVRASERAAELTAKMLAYAGEGSLFIELTDLNKLVRDACDSMRASLPGTIELNIRPGRDLPPVTVDPRQMRQVIVDLVRNSVEAISEGVAGTILVRTGTLEVSEGTMPAVTAGKYVELEVWDSGCGMNQEVQKKIFDPFFTTKFIGRGLGLAAVHGFVRSSGGGVEVDSAPGQGTHFRLLLPVMPLGVESRGAAL